MLRDEVVTRRNWLREQEFLDLIGAANLIPGPTSTEVIMHGGYRRAGWLGLLAGGVCFILPAAAIVLVFAWLYVRYGTTPAGENLLYGIKPVVVAIVVQAVWGLGRTALRTRWFAALGVAVLALYLLGGNEIVLIAVAALLTTVIVNRRRLRRPRGSHSFAPVWALPLPVLFAVAATASVPYSLQQLFLSFLKIGTFLYGSGYVLLTFLQSEFVDRLGWISQDVLLDAVAIGQFTPGPLFTTATFIGYYVGGFEGAVVATVGIFLPAFIFVAISVPLLPHVRRSSWTSAALDGVNAAAVALMAGVAWQLGRAAVIDWLTALLAILAAVALVRFKVNSVWLVLAGGAVGLLYKGLA
jgi:chromate transporter